MPEDGRVFVFDHVSVGVENLERSAEFYDACLAVLGYVRLWRNARSVGYGKRSIASMRRRSAKAVSMRDHRAFARTTTPATTRRSSATLTAIGWKRCCTSNNRSRGQALKSVIFRFADVGGARPFAGS
jgi:hypothetical protein